MKLTRQAALLGLLLAFPFALPAQDDAAVGWDPVTHCYSDSGEILVIGAILIASVLLVRLLIYFRAEIPSERLRVRWPSSMAVCLCFGFWAIDSGRMNGVTPLNGAISLLAALSLALNAPIAIAAGAIWPLIESFPDPLRFTWLAMIAWAAWRGLIEYCESYGCAREITWLNLTPPPPEHKS